MVLAPRSCILVIAPPGVSLGETVPKLSTRIGAEVADIEDEIKKNPETRRILQDIDASFAPPFDMQTVTHHIPRPQIAKLWTDAFGRCLQKLEDSNKKLRLLSGHISYYSVKRSEFYSVVNLAPLLGRTRLKVDKVLLLVDDVYDMYARLRKLYSPSLIAPFMKRMNVDPNKPSREMLARATVAWKTRNILHLLFWRNIESILGENLARQLKANFLVWPVKQLNVAIEKWLTSETKSVYLSHPIADPRAQRNRTGRWSDFVTQVNRLQKSFAFNGITLAEPTGIDELRFAVEKAGVPENRLYTGQLSSRWPLIARKSSTLYVQPRGAEGIEHANFLTPHYWDEKSRRMIQLKAYGRLLRDEIHAYCQVLIGEIESQISSRDFLFVYNTEGLLVFRPFFGSPARPGFSGGVDSEVRLWEDIVQLGVPSRIAFIHFEEDVRSMLQAQKKSEMRRLIVDQMWILLKAVASIERDVVEAMVLNHGNLQQQQEDILNKSNISPADAERFERVYRQHWREAKTEVLKRFLTDAVNVGVGEEVVGTWIVENYTLLRPHLSNIANFLRNKEVAGRPFPRGNHWEAEIDTLFHNSLIT